MSLNSVVNGLVRAAANIPSNISDVDLDKHVAELLASEARAKEVKWSEMGLGAYIDSRGSPDPNAPRPNKRFLASVIRTVDGHNSALLREQAQAARQVRESRGESSRTGAGRLFGGALRSMDRDRKDGRERRRGDERDGERERENRAMRRRREGEELARRLGESEEERKMNGVYAPSGRREDEREGKRGGEDCYRATRREQDREDRVDRRRDRSEDAEDSRRSRRRDEEKYRKYDDRHRQDEIRSRSRRERSDDGDEARPTTSRKGRLHRDDPLYEDNKLIRDEKRTRVDDDNRKISGRRDKTIEDSHKGSRRDQDIEIVSPRKTGRRKVASPSLPPKPPSQPPPPELDIPSPPSSTPISPISKMDKYFAGTYDPRLDVGVVPKEGMIAAVGWDNMLAILKDRGKKRRQTSPGLSDDIPSVPKGILLRSPSPPPLRALAKEKKKKKRGGDSESEEERLRERVKRKEKRKKEKERETHLKPGSGVMEGYEYVRKGGVREWDKGK